MPRFYYISPCVGGDKFVSTMSEEIESHEASAAWARESPRGVRIAKRLLSLNSKRSSIDLINIIDSNTRARDYSENR